VVLGQPVAAISEALGVARELAAAAQRARGVATMNDGREVEDRERDHGATIAQPGGRARGSGARPGCSVSVPGGARATRRGPVIPRNEAAARACDGRVPG